MNIEINLYNFLLLFMFLCNFFHYFVEGCNNGSTEESCVGDGDGADKNIIMKTISISTSTTSTIGNMKQRESLSSLITNETVEVHQEQQQHQQQQLQQALIERENDEKDAGSKQILSRKRRYLSFPSGSSFQVGTFLDLFINCFEWHCVKGYLENGILTLFHQVSSGHEKRTQKCRLEKESLKCGLEK